MLPVKPLLACLFFFAFGPLCSLKAERPELAEQAGQVQVIQLYTVSRDGKLYQLEITGNRVRRSLLATLETPFNQKHARTEGLAVAQDGSLYASVIFVSRFRKVSRLYRITPAGGNATLVGDIATTEIDGLDFGPDGNLYGAVSSGTRARARGLPQIVRIDTQTGAASPTETEISFDDLDALAIDASGRALVTDGSRGVYSVDPTQTRGSADVFTDDEFRQFLRTYDEMEGLCVAQEGVLFGICDEERTFLVRLDPQTRKATPIAPLGISALCLAAPKMSTPNLSDGSCSQRRRLDENNMGLLADGQRFAKSEKRKSVATCVRRPQT